jgi:hypothetical protein
MNNAIHAVITITTASSFHALAAHQRNSLCRYSSVIASKGRQPRLLASSPHHHFPMTTIRPLTNTPSRHDRRKDIEKTTFGFTGFSHQ